MDIDGRTIKKSLKVFQNSTGFLRNSVFKIYDTEKWCTRLATDRTESVEDSYPVSCFQKTSKRSYYTVFSALSNGVLKIPFRASFRAKILSEKLFHFLVDIR